MNDYIANHIDSYRARLGCLDQEGHRAIWENQPPQIFATKVTAAREATRSLAELAARQSAPTTGTTKDKAREKDELEQLAFRVARALVLFCKDKSDETMAARYDLPLSGWRRMRDEALLQRARLL
ncbi:hypothetical protein [Roseibacillus ishigakijimensis]|uniref:Uncharacterized protein n=1 Tax=Roseibacillus ishigakijimensis TaxID=454146 RepID=A0A934RNN6_9BACT|nr:hypothetical protein [Roseibacillus ishigakijimensis]MBK1835132.1 hypothetical protein [Roseibacillus ishigakijimensis]